MTTCSRAIGRYGLWAESHFSASVLRLFISSFMAKLFRLLEISDLLALRQQGFTQTCVTPPGFILDTAMATLMVIPADEAYLPVVTPR